MRHTEFVTKRRCRTVRSSIHRDSRHRRHWRTPGEIREAHLQLHWIKPWDPQRGLTAEQFELVKETLRDRWPVCGGFLWPKQAKWTDGILQMAPREDVRDGHSVLLVGFRDDRNQPGGGVFLVRDSGKGPHDGAMSYEYVRSYMNDAVWISHPGGPPSP